MKVGVVGNREGFGYEQVEEVLLLRLQPGDEIVSGGAIGVDSFAEQFAHKHGYNIKVFRPQYPSTRWYFKRNREIAEYCDKIIAFNKKERSGTTNTINIARKLGKE